MDAAYDAAIEVYRAGDLAGAVERLRPLAAAGHAEARRALAGVLDQMGQWEEADTIFRARAAERPEDPGVLAGLGQHYRLIRRYPEAEAAFRRALARDPDDAVTHEALGAVLLAQGKLAEGFAEYDARPARRRMLAAGLGFPEWRGEPLAGKRLFVYREQGFGDQILAARFLKRLEACAVTYAGLLPLERLFGGLSVDYLAEAKGEGLVVPRHDYWTLPLSIPARLGVDLKDLTGAAYLAAEPRRSAGRVGLVWHGEAANFNDRYRALPHEQAERLLARPGVISLHPEDTGAEDFQATAELVAGLDLVISVDTATAHLAGALGKPVWVLLAAHALDWQWMAGRSDSPWYASARVIRQPAVNDWASVVNRVLDELG